MFLNNYIIKQLLNIVPNCTINRRKYLSSYLRCITLNHVAEEKLIEHSAALAK